MPTVVISDYTFPNLDVEQAILSAAGFELRSGNDEQTNALKALVAEADAAITQFAPINADVIGAMQSAKLIVHYGIEYDKRTSPSIPVIFAKYTSPYPGQPTEPFAINGVRKNRAGAHAHLGRSRCNNSGRSKLAAEGRSFARFV